ncbi:Armadillo-type fold [Arabidopsis thaliana x Arabidopsis arenosa]|uniref:Armadillo-type fold n=1 Tax=Arabidopsis thaliana x Arabidopsis arenosa TaxID=1240361 RepID=A0A8T2BFX1_9BRAS|nr:Armadillo-type fold [Arabidopsis thaliana x Arabidopsis arenosa]
MLMDCSSHILLASSQRTWYWKKEKMFGRDCKSVSKIVHLQDLPDKLSHDMLSETDIKSAKVSKTANHSLKKGLAGRETANLGRRDTEKLTKGHCTYLAKHSILIILCPQHIYFLQRINNCRQDKGKTAKEESRELMLKEEASTREIVHMIQKSLSLVLHALGEIGLANPVFCHSQLPFLLLGQITLRIYSLTSFFLPRSLAAQFQKYLQLVLPAILDGFADENESVHDAALGAGHILVEHHDTASLPLLLPAAEDGISMIIGVSVKVLWNCLGIYCSRLENERMYYYSITTEKCLNTCGFDVATFLSTNVESVCKSLLGPMGLMSPKTPEQQAAVYSLSTMMSLAPEVTFTVFKMHLQDLPDRLSHNMLSETDIKIFHTPEGMLLSEQGIYVAQTIGAKYTKQEPSFNPGRQGITLALQSAADNKGPSCCYDLFDIPLIPTHMFVERGCCKGFGFHNLSTRNPHFMLIPTHMFVERGSMLASDEEEYDLVREGVVIFTGALAKHLAKDDPKVHNVVEKLLEVLNTPSESVKRAVSTCPSPLVLSKQEDAPALFLRLLDKLMKSDKYGERRGAAFGLAGVVMGFGISSLKKYGLIVTLQEALKLTAVHGGAAYWGTKNILHRMNLVNKCVAQSSLRILANLILHSSSKQRHLRVVICVLPAPGGVLAPGESVFATVFKFVEHPEDNEKQKLNQKSKVKFKIISLKVKPGVKYVPELFDEQKDQVAVEQVLRVIFIDADRPSAITLRIYFLTSFVIVLIKKHRSEMDTLRFSSYYQDLWVLNSRSLADENESVRDAALGAGRVLVEHHATASLPLLLPVGIFNDNWRIRQSSVELLGDLLFKITYIKYTKDVKGNNANFDESLLPARRRLRLDPSSYLLFPYEPGKQVCSEIKLKNTSKSHTAFKFQTTAPKSCYMRPPGGVLAPRESVFATVFKFVEHPENNEKQKLNQKSKVKFKIISLKVKPGVEYVPELFDEQKDQVAVETGPRVVGEGLVIDEWKERREKYLARQQVEAIDSSSYVFFGDRAKGDVLVDPIPETSNHSLKKGLAGRETTNLGRRDTAKLTKKAEKGKTAKEEARELMLKEEASKKSFVGASCPWGDGSCQSCVLSQPVTFLATFLDPLLRSPIVSAAAFENLEMLARCTVQPLCNWALEISTSLRLTAIDELDASSDFRPSIDKDGKTYEDNYKWDTGANFTVIKADKLHSDVLHILCCSRISSISWTCVNGLCLGLQAADVAKALYGVYSKDVHVRMACLNAADPNKDVRGKMINAGNVIIDKHGKENVSLLFPIFENYLNKEASDEEEYDLVRGVVIFSGALSKSNNSSICLYLDTYIFVDFILSDKAWRTKQSSVQFLGDMAFSAPQQLSQCLPRAVPKLTEVIKNPEISSLVPTLLLALTDPSEYTRHSLDILLQTTFVNSVDGPSLALLDCSFLRLERFLWIQFPRSGAAQGLSEVIAALGTDYFENILPDLIRHCSHQKASVRDGYLTLFKFLPRSLGAQFEKYLQLVLPAILNDLAHENESVRDAALGAGHVLVEHHATTSLPLLRPVVEDGIFNANWRIRQSFVELLGDLLFKLARRSLGELVRKLGERVLPLIIPKLSKGLTDPDVDKRQDVCIGLNEVMATAGRTSNFACFFMLLKILHFLTSTTFFYNALEVRESAGLAFSTLYKSAGLQAMDEIIPTLLEALEDDEMSTTALDELKQIICVRTAAVLPHILSKLVHLPLSYVAGVGFNTHLGTILPILLSAMGDENKEVQELAQEAAERVVLVIDEGVENFSKECLIVRRSYAYLIGYIFKSSKLYLIDEAPNMISTLIVMLSDSDLTTVRVSWEALARVIGSVPKEVLPSYIKLVRVEFTIRICATCSLNMPFSTCAIKARGPWPFFRLLDKLMESDKYGERREAAFGVERVVMGFGISSLTKYGLIVTPQEALIDRCMCRPSCGAPCGTLLQLLLFLVCHPSWNVRKTVYNSVTKIFLATSQLATTLLDEFSDFLSVTGDQIVSSRTRCVSEGFDYHSVAGPSSSWIVRAIFYLHHPSIVGTRKRDVVWKRLQKCLKPRGYDVATFCLPIEKVFARDDIVIWVQKKTGAPIITLNSVVEAQRFLNKYHTFVLSLFDKFEGSEHNEFVKAAKSDDEIHYTVYDGSYKMEKILEFLGSNKFPLITKLTDTNTVWVMLFSKADDFQKLAQALEDIARKFKSKYLPKSDPSPNNIEELCSGLAHGVVSRYYKSEPVPYNSSNHSLRHSSLKEKKRAEEV